MSRSNIPIVPTIITMVYGLVLVASAILVVLDFGSEIDWKAGIGALLIGGIGVEAVLSATRKRRSWLERIGPLP